MDPMLYCCCGLDVHKDIIEACIIKGEGSEPEIFRCQFNTSRESLRELVDWLANYDCFSVAMESTGVYWYMIYDTLIEKMAYKENIYVVNAHHMKNLPGRKSDVKDAEWIASLFRHGLLSRSFVPDAKLREVREFTRLLRTYIQEQSRYKNRIEKFLQSHGFKFSTAMSDVFCQTGIALLNILKTNGEITEEDAKKACRRLRTLPIDETVKLVSGKLNASEQCLLKHLLQTFDSSSSEIKSLKDDIRHLTDSYKTEIDLIQSIPGIAEDSATEIIAEISPAPQEFFSNADKLCAWAGLVPRNDQSAGKIKSKKILHGNPRIKAILCQVAWVSVYARDSIYHDWYWSHVKALGEKKAIIAVSRKILKTIYLLLSKKTQYKYLKKTA